MAIVARTREITDPGDLIALLPAESPISWVRQGGGLVAWGEVARCDSTGPDRFVAASTWWRGLCADASIDDPVKLPGTGLIGVGSFAFADEPGTSALVIPKVVVGRRRHGGDMRAWVTVIGDGTGEVPLPHPQPAPQPPSSIAIGPGSLSSEEWQNVVGEAVRRINSGELEKVVMARDLIASAPEPIDVRWPISQLANKYQMCWTFHVDGLFGATPELLVRRERGLVTSRVLAGTIRRTGDESQDAALAGQLARSSKDLEEHEYAVRSVAESLQPFCSSMNVPEVPFVLHLPNVMHLATDVTGVVAESEGANVVELAASLHPSAAVGGTPTKVAVELIDHIEQLDRDRYAGPVGWIDASGDGEFGIALRSAVVTDQQVRLFAGCGIVGNSDPSSELAEAAAKFEPVREALDPASYSANGMSAPEGTSS